MIPSENRYTLFRIMLWNASIQTLMRMFGVRQRGLLTGGAKPR